MTRSGAENIRYWLASVTLIALLGGGRPTAAAGTTASPDPASGVRNSLGEEPIRTESQQAARQTDPITAAHPGQMDYPRVLGALTAVIALIFLLRWCGRLFFPAAAGRGSSRVVEVLSRSPLAPKQQVMLIRVGERLVLVGDSGGQMTALCEISQPDEVARLVGQLREEKAAAPVAFGSIFGRFRRIHDLTQEAAAQPAPPLQDESDPAPVPSAQDELLGLRQRVRLLAEQFNVPSQEA